MLPDDMPEGARKFRICWYCGGLNFLRVYSLDGWLKATGQLIEMPMPEPGPGEVLLPPDARVWVCAGCRKATLTVSTDVTPDPETLKRLLRGK